MGRGEQTVGRPSATPLNEGPNAASDPHRLARSVYGVARGRGTASLRVLDFGVILAAWLLGYLAGFGGDTSLSPRDFIPYLLIPLALQLFVNQVMGLYGPVWRYASVDEAVRVVAAVSIGTFASTFVLAWVSGVQDTTLPLLTAPPVAALLILLGCGGIRFQAASVRARASARRQDRAPAHADRRGDRRGRRARPRARRPNVRRFAGRRFRRRQPQPRRAFRAHDASARHHARPRVGVRARERRSRRHRAPARVAHASQRDRSARAEDRRASEGARRHLRRRRRAAAQLAPRPRPHRPPRPRARTGRPERHRRLPRRRQRARHRRRRFDRQRDRTPDRAVPPGAPAPPGPRRQPAVRGGVVARQGRADPRRHS